MSFEDRPCRAGAGKYGVDSALSSVYVSGEKKREGGREGGVTLRTLCRTACSCAVIYLQYRARKCTFSVALWDYVFSYRIIVAVLEKKLAVTLSPAGGEVLSAVLIPHAVPERVTMFGLLRRAGGVCISRLHFQQIDRRCIRGYFQGVCLFTPERFSVSHICVVAHRVMLPRVQRYSLNHLQGP